MGEEKIQGISYQGRWIPFFIVRQKRKTIGIVVEAVGRVVIKAPFGVSKEELATIVEKKGSWIAQKLEDMEKRNQSRKQSKKAQDYESGSEFLFKGKTCRLEIKSPDERKEKAKIARIEGTKRYVCWKIEEGVCTLYLRDSNPQQITAVLQEIIRLEAGEILKKRVQYYAQVMKEEVHQVFIKEQKTRWGSCSSKRNINLNWKLVLAPCEVLDYVVIHELCHLKHMNHSKEFWEWVRHWCPEYEKWRKWLKENGTLLEI